MIDTVRQLMHNIRLFCGTQCSAASSWRQARTKFFRTTDEADTAHVVSGLPTARKPWYIFSRLRSNCYITCVQCERATLPILNHMPPTFSLLPVFRRVLSKQGENSAALINVAINFVYEYFSFVIHFSKLFFIKTFSQNFFPKFFSQTFFQNLFFKIFFNIFFQKFFSQNYFPTSFQNLFFEGFTLDNLPFTETKNRLYISVLWKIWYTCQYSIPITAYNIFST